MTNTIIYIVTITLALLIADEIIPGLMIDTPQTALFAAVVLGVLNSVIKPILIILTFPITIVTLGLFILVINVSLFGLAAWLLPVFILTGWLPALLGTLLISLTSLFVQKMKTD